MGTSNYYFPPKGNLEVFQILQHLTSPQNEIHSPPTYTDVRIFVNSIIRFSAETLPGR